MFCTECGKEIKDSAAFCPFCGTNTKPKRIAEPISTNSKEDNPVVEPLTPPVQPIVQPVVQPVIQPVVPPTQTIEPKVESKKAKKSSKSKLPVIIISIIVVLALAGLGFVGYTKFIGKGTNPGSDSTTTASKSESETDTDTDSEQESKPKSEPVLDEPDDDWTIMIFMSGADLEHESGLMSKSIKSIKEATYGDNINVIVQTGGSTKWFDEDINPEKVQRWSIENGEMKLLEEFDVDHYITPESLSNFMSSTIKAFPAKRYGVVLNSHGGGTLSGFGIDDNYPEDRLSIANLHEAFDINKNDTGVKFDFIGFDACLMATIDVAYALKDYADYMIASEESEVAFITDTEGYNTWAYGDFLTELNNNPSMPMNDDAKQEGLGRLICSTYFDSYDYDDVNNAVYIDEKAKITLSLIDLSKIDDAYNAMCEFYSEANDYITTSEESWNKIVKARVNCLGFGDDSYDQIDIIDFLNNAELGLEKMHDWQNAIRSVIAYSRNDAKNANGLAMYFPFYYYNEYNNVKKNLEAIGYDDRYFNFFTPFIAKVQGNMSSNSTAKAESDPTAENDSGNNSNSALWDETIAFSEASDGSLYISLSEEQLSALDMILSQHVVMLSDEVYTFVGELPNYLTLDNNLGLVLPDSISVVLVNDKFADLNYRYKGTYTDSGETYYYNTAYARVNGKDTEVVILTDWTDGEYTASIRGYYDPESDDKETRIPFKEGDTIEFEYFTFDGDLNPLDSFYSDPIVAGVDGSFDVEVYSEACDSYFRYRMIDIYGNNYYSEFRFIEEN